MTKMVLSHDENEWKWTILRINAMQYYWKEKWDGKAKKWTDNKKHYINSKQYFLSKAIYLAINTV